MANRFTNFHRQQDTDGKQSDFVNGELVVRVKGQLSWGQTLHRKEKLTSANGKWCLELKETSLLLFSAITPDGDSGGAPRCRYETSDGSGAVIGVMEESGSFVFYSDTKVNDKGESYREPKFSIDPISKGNKGSTLYVLDSGNLVIRCDGKDIWRMWAVDADLRGPPHPVGSTPNPGSSGSMVAYSNSLRPASSTTMILNGTSSNIAGPTATGPATTGPAAPGPSAASPVLAKPSNEESAKGVVQPSKFLIVPTVLRGGQSFLINQPIYSPNGKISMNFQEDGDLCVKDQNRTLWSSNTNGKDVKVASLKENGDLVLLKTDGNVEWRSESAMAQSAKDTVLLVQDDGHAVILCNGALVWRSFCRKLDSIDRDRLKADEYLGLEQPIFSPNGQYQLALKLDGWFRLSSHQGRTDNTVWEVNNLQGAVTITMKSDDNLVAGDGIWTSTTKRRKKLGNAVLILGDNGVATIKSDGLTLWSTDEKKVPLDNFEALETTPVASASDRMRVGEHLTVDGQFTSKNGQFIARLADNGGFGVWRRTGTGQNIIWEYVWSAKASSGWYYRLCLEWTGRLALYGLKSKALWTAGSPQSEQSVELILQDDGNLILQRKDELLFASEVNFPVSVSKAPVDRIRWREWLSLDQTLVSNNGLYTLTLQDNGNFCIKKKGGDAVYTKSVTNQTGARLLNYNGEKNDLQIYDRWGKNGKTLWKAGNTTPHDWQGNSSFILHDDGNAIFWINDKVVWESNANLVSKPLSSNT